jgi:hypothetical protein
MDACRPFVVSTCTARVERPLVLIDSIGGRTSLTFTRWTQFNAVQRPTGSCPLGWCGWRWSAAMPGGAGLVGRPGQAG